MKIITIGQRKGGNGKSTCTLNLAHVLAETGKKVLVIDLDDQKNTSSAINKKTVIKHTIEDLLLDDSISLTDAVCETNWNNVYLVPASGNLSGVIKQLDSEVGGHLILDEKIKDNNDFDIILIDTSPSLNILVINALCSSDYLLIPLSSKYFSLQGLGQTLSAFKKVKARLKSSIELLGIVFVIHDKRNTLANEVILDAIDNHKDLIFKSIIGLNIKIEEAQVNKQSILSYSPVDRGSEQYRALGKEVLNRMGE